MGELRDHCHIRVVIFVIKKREEKENVPVRRTPNTRKIANGMV